MGSEMCIRDSLQISDTGALESLVTAALAANPEAVERYQAGEGKVIGFLVGAVMRDSGGKADPTVVNELLRQSLDS